MKDRNGQDQLTRVPDPGATRLLKILISESAYLIWTLLCERTIREQVHTDREVNARWRQAINKRLTEDKITATTVLKNERYITIATSTWDRALHKRHRDLPEDWMNRSVVF